MNLESGSLDYQLMTSSSFLFWIGALISVLVILVVFTVIIVKKKEVSWSALLPFFFAFTKLSFTDFDTSNA